MSNERTPIIEAMDDETLIDYMRKAASAVYLATDSVVADDLSALLREAANRLEPKLVQS